MTGKVEPLEICLPGLHAGMEGQETGSPKGEFGPSNTVWEEAEERNV